MKNITLIGMPGAGKSTVGVLLAKKIGADFIDTDLLIQKKHKKLLQQIVDELGFYDFVKDEGETIMTVSPEYVVIATGGSAVYNDKAMEYLKSFSEVIYLKLSFEEMMSRINNVATRGIVLNEGQSMEELFNERIPLYEKYADVTIDCTGKNPEEVLAKILN